MLFQKERVQVIAEQLKKNAIVCKAPLYHWQIKEGLFFRPGDVEASPEPWLAFDSKRAHWEGPDRYYWFRTELTVTPDMDGKPLWIAIKTQIDEWDDGKNPQFLLFVDGVVRQGMDMNHREMLITPAANVGQSYTIDLQAYTGTLHSDFRLLGEAYCQDAQVMALYYDIQVPLWSLERMDAGGKVRIDLENALNRTVNLLDLRTVPSAAFSASVDEARIFIRRAVFEELAGQSDIIATCIGHTHIDVAWWWTVSQTREKTARSFSTVLKLMEEYPDYKFMSSQPQLYVFLKERYPELYAAVKARVAEGRWEPEGGMWIEADCNLTSGESLVRQFLYGKRFFLEEFGVDNRILWLPDVFGYSGALPQIMKLCGIDYFMTTKLSWNQLNKIPHDTLMWRGIDGSEVLAHFITTPGVGQPSEKFFTTYNGLLHPDAVIGAWERYQDKDINNDVLMCFGYGDGGGGPTRDMLETSSRLANGLKGVPQVRQGFAGEYFKRLESTVKDNRQLSTWIGEFYFEYHRGTYTSMARNKRANRKSELMLMDLEFLSVMTGMTLRSELDSMWKTILLNQFHDILPGTSIHEVYEVTKAEYEAVAAQGGALTEKALTKLCGQGDAVVLVNTLGFVRSDIVHLGATGALALTDGQRVFPVQQTAEGAVAFIRDIPSKGYKSYRPCEPEIPASPFTVTEQGIETPFYSIAFDKDGTISSLFDKENARETIRPNGKANRLCVYEDKPIYYDNWDIDIFYTEKSWDVCDIVSREWTEVGPVRATLETAYTFASSRIVQKIRFYSDLRRIDFETVVDWRESQHLLKVHFAADIHTDEASFEIQFGNVTRKTHQNTSWDLARFESCGQKWADISECGYGVSLLNDCKYGYSVLNNELSLSLIKSGIEPNPIADQERHIFTYSLSPHAGDWREGHTAQAAAMLNQPVIAKNGADGLARSFLRVDCEHVCAETIKPAEDGDGFIVRLYEYHNRRGAVKVTFESPILSASACDLLERPLGKAEIAGCDLRFEIKPYEIKTYRVRFRYEQETLP